MADEPHFIDGVGTLLVLLGVNPTTVQLNFEHNGSTAMLAMPDSKVALTTEGDEPEGLIADEWFVQHMDVNALKALARGFSMISSLAIEHEVRASAEAMLKSGSSEEERLLQGILRANIREPDRNHKLLREDGTELTVPDFTWADLKLAFFVDGLWWHVAKDDSETLKQIAKSKKNSAELVRQNKSRAERDAANRSEMVLNGWTWLSCTDRDLATDVGVKKQVDNILRMMRTLHKQRRNAASIEQEHTAEQVGDYIPETIPDPVGDTSKEMFPPAELVKEPARKSRKKLAKDGPTLTAETATGAAATSIALQLSPPVTDTAAQASQTVIEPEFEPEPMIDEAGNEQLALTPSDPNEIDPLSFF